MIRVAVVADSHFDEHSRFEECVRVHDWISEDIAARNVDLVLHSGDVYERRSTPREREAVADWVQAIAAFAPVVIARGNHDAIGDLPLLERLETKYDVHVYENAGTLPVGGCAVGVMGWPQRSRLHAMEGAGGHDAVESMAGDALRSVLRGIGAELADYDEARPRILLAHAMVRSSHVSTGQPLVGCDFELGIEDLALAGADFFALGHIHLGQDWDCAGAPVVYPGSPRRANFGEVEKKGYLLIEFDGRELVSWKRVETPCTPMIHIESHWYSEHIGLPGDVLVPAGLTSIAEDLPHCKGAEVRLRYTTPSDQREATGAQAQAMADQIRAAGAISVKIEEQLIVEQRARAPEVARVATLADKLQALWDSKGFDAGERRETLLAKASELEAINAA